MCWLGISTWSPPKSFAWQKGFRLGSGLTWNLLGLLLEVGCLLLLVSVPGVPLVVTVGTSWWVALLRRLPSLLVWSSQTGGLCLILLLGLILIALGGLCLLLSWFSVHHCLLPGCLLWIKVGVPSLLRFGEFGRFMMIGCSSWLWWMLSSWMSLWMQVMSC